MIPKWVRKTKVARKLSKMFVNHLGLTLTKEDLQHVVDLMEPYGQISNGIELLTPPLNVRNYLCPKAYNVVNLFSKLFCHATFLSFIYLSLNISSSPSFLLYACPDLTFISYFEKCVNKEVFDV